MRNIVKFVLLLLFFPSFLFAQWIQQMTPTHAIYDVEFINLKTGWACGSNIIYKTTNAGTNWIIQPNPAKASIIQIFPLDSNLLYAVGDWTILKTTNSGTNWMGIRTGGPGSGYATLEGAYFLNENTGWLCGNVCILKTTDGCVTFDSMRVEGSMKDIYFKDSLNGVMCGEGVAFYTTDGGTNWLTSSFSTWTSHLFRMKFINDYTGWTISLYPIIFKTTNFGVSWDSISFLPYDVSRPGGYGIDFLDSNLGFCAADGGIFKTTNSGRNWNREQTSQFGSAIYYDLNVLTDSIVYAGGNLRFLYTNSGGQVGVKELNSTIPDNYTLFQNFPNPFNPITNIEFSLPQKSFVKLKVYNLLGKEMATLVNENLSAGKFRYEFNATLFTSGIYFYNLETENFFETRKMVLVK